MLRSLKDLESYKVAAIDGDIGHVERFLFDDENWTVRYLVVQTGGPLFLQGRQVLISPIAFRRADHTTHRFHVGMTMQTVSQSPSVDTAKPVSRQRERDISRYYNYPYYWGGSGNWGMGAQPVSLATGGWNDPPVGESGDDVDDFRLRSDEEVRGYHIQGSDGLIGHVDDFIVDDETWEVRYLVINTSNWWWFGKNVLVAPSWASHVSWTERRVHVELTRLAIKNCPEWDATQALEREYESRLFEHYQRQAYWVDSP